MRSSSHRFSTSRLGRAALALLGASWLAGCADAAPAGSREAPTGSAEQAIIGGTLDTAGEFSAVVAVVTASGGFATGIAISDRVVVTAAHLLPEVVRGCGAFNYVQPASPGAPAMTGVYVQTADASGDTASPTLPAANRYSVDAVSGRRRVAPLNAYDCCAGNPSWCDACDVSTAAPNWLHAFDIVLLHLDRPLQGVKPMSFIARIGPEDKARRTFPIDPSTWAGNVVGTLVGVGGTSLGGQLGPRRFGPTTITKFGQEWDIAARNHCDLAQKTKVACDDCMIGVSGKPSSVLPSGGPSRIGGDSGAPVIVNDTAHGGTAIAGLPPNTPFIVGFGSWGSWDDNGDGTTTPLEDNSVVTWDTAFDSGESIETGSFIQSHLGDWDQDGIPDAFDNCPIAPNPDQANCNQAAEDARGFVRAGDACDPVPCAESTPAPASYQGQTLQSSFITDFYGVAVQDVIDVSPHGSHYWSSGAQNHRALPEVPVGTVDTHYRFCQENSQAGVVCSSPSVVGVSYLNKEPTSPDATRPWMKVRMKAVSNPMGTFDHEPLAHPSAPTQRRWVYADDYADWAGSGKIAIPASCDATDGCCQALYGCGTNLGGRFWTHSSTSKGGSANPAQPAQSSAFLPPSTGYHPKSGAASFEDVNLFSNYVDLHPDAKASFHKSKPLYPVPYFRWMWWWPDPMRPAGWDGSIFQDTALMQLDDGHLGLLLQNGEALVADDLVGAGLKAALADTSIRWVDPAEPMLAVASTRFNAGVLALGLSGDGTTVTHRVMKSGHRIGTDGETGAGSCVAPPSALLGWWPLDNGAADIASSGSAHHGKTHGDVTAGAGVVGGDALFAQATIVNQPGGYMEVPNDDGAFDIDNDFTVEAWIDARNPAGPTARGIVSHGGHGWSIGVAADGTLQATKERADSIIATPIVVAPERWQHVAVAFTQGGTKFYVDGQLAHFDQSALGSGSISYVAPREPLLVATMNPERGFFDGWLDEVSIYRRVLSGEEIAAIAAAGIHGKCKTSAPPASAPQGPSPSRREGWKAVLSRAENAVFVLGGEELATREQLHDIWMQRVDPPGAWTEVRPRGLALGTVVDATWSHQDRRLWVLDERVVDRETMVRLVRIDPHRASSELVAEWPRRSNAEQRWLTVDREGRVLLVSSSSGRDRHTVMRFEVTPFEDARSALTSLAVRSGHLAWKPILDASGYGFVLRTGERDVQIERVPALQLEPCHAGDDEIELE